MVESNGKDLRSFSERNYAVPFGRYQPGGNVGPPANEVLVGREGQRAYFIDLLFQMGRQGAFLVTGHRGAGKTSFVRHCLSVYKEEVLERFLHSNVGRATFWDRLGVMAIGLSTLFVLSMVHQLIEIFTQPDAPPSPLIWIMLVPLAIICLYPLLYAREVLRRVLEVFQGNNHWRSNRFWKFNPNVLSVFVVSALVFLAWYFPPFGSPYLSMSRMVVAISFIYLWVQCLSFNDVIFLDKPGADAERRMPFWLSASLIAAVLMATVALLVALGWLKYGPHEPFANLCIALCSLGIGNVLRGLHLRSSPQVSKSEDMPKGSQIPEPPYWYMFSGASFFLTGAAILWASQSMQGLLVALTLAAVSLTCYWLGRLFLRQDAVPGQRSGGYGISFRPRSSLVLCLKAFLCVVVTLQLLHPLIIRSTRWALNSSSDVVLGAVGAIIAPVPVQGEYAEGEERSLRKVPGTPTRRLFPGESEEISWVFALFMCLLLLYYLEYEWVVRPFVKKRLDPGGSASPWDDQIPEWGAGGVGYRNLAKITLPWVLYKSWLPVLTIPVNLGFEKLDHRRVVHAMLAGLRAKYHRAFLSWSSGFANLLRIIGLLLTLVLVNLVGSRWFEMRSLGNEVEVDELKDYRKPCALFQGPQKGSVVTNVICKIPGGDTLFHILYFNLLDIDRQAIRAAEGHLLLNLILPYRQSDWPGNRNSNGAQLQEQGAAQGATERSVDPLLKGGIHFEVYHLVLFLMLYMAGRWFLGRFPLLPYRETLLRIDEVMDFLSARTSVTSRTNRWEPIQALQGWLTDERTRQIEQEPVDPRAVEFLFLQILEDIQTASVHLAGARDQLISLPTPEITFVFDELDKLGTRVDPGEKESSGGTQQVEILHAERKRSMELHKLLPDMKNMLSSAPARFIFVGGRNLHDEWLADQSARQPLLTNIFSAEVYLPSLVTDLGRIEPGERSLARNIRIYLESQALRARALYHASYNKLRLPSLALPIEDPNEESFIADTRGPQEKIFASLCSSDPGELEKCIASEDLLAGILFRDFYQFLTYRSMGNPKRLKEVLGTFVRPVERVVKSRDLRWTRFKDCDHVLSFGDIERFRVQLLARIYRNLALTLERKLVRRDDKLAISVFFISDFLFKFHRRAFSWSNLERVDEIAHIHRAPDLREILESMVMQWSERFLHPIRNGMYDFRFRSDLAREVEYISRQSHEEMAAFNFTLDESQALKAAYIANISLLKEKVGHESVDMVAGLGELHEFDQEYEDARVHYNRAIALLDKELEQVAGWSREEAQEGGRGWDRSPILDVLAATESGQELSRLYMTWGIARLRLMLQIGMTFELARNLERAGVEYRNAHTLARAFLSAMLKDRGRDDDRLDALKHLNILFQPAFAEAWVAEKLAGSVDTSVSLIEKELWQIRKTLPFVQEHQLYLSSSPGQVRSSNFAISMAELHNKAGDIYFFKGRQKVTIGDLQEMLKRRGGNEMNPRYEGYLLRGHYHYALALHDLRRFVTHRRYSSSYKLNIYSREAFADGLWPTISRESWPDFIYRSAGGSLNDLGESMLGRVSLYGILSELGSLPLGAIKDGWGTINSAKVSITKGFVDWMEGARYKDEDRGRDVEERLPLDMFIPIGGKSLRAGTLESWLGQWVQMEAGPYLSKDCALIEFKDIRLHNNVTRLAVALQIKLVGSKMLEKGGYVEDAAHELLGVCEVVTSYLWWFLSIEKILEWVPHDEHVLPAVRAAFWSAKDALKGFAAYMAQVALYSIRKSDSLFRLGRRAEEVKDRFVPGSSKAEYLIGNKIPVAQLINACALGLSSCGLGVGDRVAGGIFELFTSWGISVPSFVDEQHQVSFIRDLLKQALVRHSYPMIGRLEGLKALIDDQLLNKENCPGEEIRAWTSELMKLTSDLSAPMHFTPLHSGVTYALAYFRSWELVNAPAEGEELRVRESLQRSAQRDLAMSEQMYTLRGAYYESISDLAYLYDDFKDRQIHIRHAIQMAGAEINALLMYLVTQADYIRPEFFSSLSDLRRWLEKNHSHAAELWVKLCKENCDDSGITYSKALDEFLCFGWTGRGQRSIDKSSCIGRFTPYKPGSSWSKKDVRSFLKLGNKRRLPGLAVFMARDKSGKADAS